MEAQVLARSKLFILSRKTLEKRIKAYYKETNDGQGTLEMLVALQVREELCEQDLSFLLRELVQHIFLKKRSTAAMRRYYLYFAEYFGKKEWQSLSAKLFPVQTYIMEKLEELTAQVFPEVLAGLTDS